MQARTRIAISTAAAAILGFTAASMLRAQAAAPALDDPTIVAIFDAANTADIETSGLAVTRASHKDVRELGRTFVHDHTSVRQQGRDLAKKLGVTPTPPKDDTSARDHAAAMKKLEGLSGAEFDRAYLAHEVAYHKAVLDAIQKTLVPAIKNAELKAFVLKVGPAFQGHLAAAEKLAQKYDVQASAAQPAAQSRR